MSQIASPDTAVASVTSTQKRPVSFDLDSPELAATYDRVGVRQYEHGKLLIADLAISEGEKVLDIGSGTGLLSSYVAARVGPGGRVTGVDPLPHRVALAKGKAIERGLRNLDVQVGRAEDLSGFDDASFDVVYLNSVFHWIEDKPRALAEIFRVLKPGGRLGLNSGDAERPHQSAQLLKEAAQDAGIPAARQPDGRNLGAVSNAELQSLLTAAGFVDYQGDTRTIVDDVPDAADLLAWSRSSSFGNAQVSFHGDEQARFVAAVNRRLETFRSAEGIRLERYLIFATARRPQLA
ncbi:MAG: methyltransferase domain-containing protein [Moraxellaceae bacterium]|nr:methyltransferase domain-containing protein [Moraxellaceae bacterium]